MDFENSIHGWMLASSLRTEKRTGVSVAHLLEASLGRVMRNDAKRAGRLDRSAYDESKIDHICDWLVASIARGEGWLQRRDANGNIPKLVKFGSFDQIVAEADKAMRKRRNEIANGIHHEAGVEKVHDCGDGYAIYRLKTPEALDREGFTMGHCVGDGAYDIGLRENFVAVYSLRDGFGKSHVTIEVNKALDTVEQIKGKGNTEPKPEYTRRLLGWLDPELTIQASEIPGGFAVDRRKGLVELMALKPGETFEGDLRFSFKDLPDTVVLPLPDGVVVEGNVRVDGGDHMERMARSLVIGNGGDTLSVLPDLVLPRGLKVSRKLEIRGCRVSLDELDASELRLDTCELVRLPETVVADCEFDAVYVKVPMPGSSFEKDVVIQRCRDFTLGPDTRVAGLLHVYNSVKPGSMTLTPAVSIEDGMRCEGEVRIVKSDLAFRGAFSCGGAMTIGRCDDIRMPSTLHVDGDLTVTNTFIDRWPVELEVGGKETYEAVDEVGLMDTFPRRSMSGGPRP